MEDKVRKIALTAKKSEPNNWLAQRNLIAKEIMKLAETHPDAFQRHEFADGKIAVVFFFYENDYYFLWDGIKDGYICECSGLERAISRPVNGKIKTEIIWNSDPDDHEPFIPKLPIIFQ